MRGDGFRLHELPTQPGERRAWWNREVTPRPVRTAQLSADQQAAVLALVAAAEEADGAPTLSEQSRLAVRGRSGHAVEHLLAYADDDLAGYLQADEESAELVVAPAHRRSGVGSRLLDQVPAGTRVWAHGDVAAAEGFAAARGLEVVRELFVLGRRFDDAAPLDDPVLPDGLVARPFRPGRDEDEWLRVNAAAFAHHAEQGRMTRADLDARMDEPWFDPGGLILVVPESDPDTVAAFHWTKIDSQGGAHGPDARRRGGTGEVYVVGVDPAYQGKGLGRPVTLLGLEYLRDQGVEDVILYVDGDNPAALRVYRGLGFTTRSVDRMFAAPTPHVDGSSPEGGTMRS
jgi:mycothiol synthase